MKAKNNFKEYLKGFGVACLVFVFAIFLIAGALWIYKHGFGHIEKGKMPKFDYSIRNTYFDGMADVLKLDNGNVLISGLNIHHCHKGREKNKFTHSTEQMPFEIYNPAKNEITNSFNMPKNLMYTPRTIILKNNKILLVDAYEEKDAICANGLTEGRFSHNPAQYDSMILYNLDKKKVEKVIKKKINAIYPNNFELDNKIVSGYALLNNEIVLLFDSFNRVIERFDLESGTSELITNLDVEYRKNSKILPYKKDKALIFDTDIKIYDDLTKTVKPYKTIKENDDYLIENPKFINENEIFLAFDNHKGIYNLETEEFKDFSALTSDFWNFEELSAESLNDKYLLFFYIKREFFFGSGLQLSIINKEKETIRNIAFIRNIPYSTVKTMKLNNGDIFIYTGDINIFKPWKWVK